MNTTVAPDLSVETVSFAPRGPLSAQLLEVLRTDPALSEAGDVAGAAARALEVSTDIVRDDDIQLALFLLYAGHYGSLEVIDAGWEWHPMLIAARGMLEQ